MISIATLRLCEAFSLLTDAELERILPLSLEVSYAKDTLLFSEEDEATTFYILLAGQVSLQYVICPQPEYCQDARILLDQPGDFFGWSTLVRPNRMTASGLCLTDVRLIAINGAELNQLLETDRHLGFAVMKALAGAINKMLREAKGLTLQRLMGSL
ncbi:MAG TPA: cyclic nucleotide-binding domain-containing protein [Anaerolineae bacterium]|nr:cyclic nucleotide-binding domain-containing protein [Anaerolineae bacterium]